VPDKQQQDRMELVDDLASSIRKKFVERVEQQERNTNRALQELETKHTFLEQKTALLAASHNRTRLLTYISLTLAGLAVLGQIFLYIK